METNHSGKVSYTTAEDFLSTSVSDFPENVSKNRSTRAVSIGGRYQERGFKYYVTINTGYIPN